MWIEKEGAYGNAERRTQFWYQLAKAPDSRSIGRLLRAETTIEGGEVERIPQRREVMHDIDADARERALAVGALGRLITSYDGPAAVFPFARLIAGNAAACRLLTNMPTA